MQCSNMSSWVGRSAAVAAALRSTHQVVLCNRFVVFFVFFSSMDSQRLTPSFFSWMCFVATRFWRAILSVSWRRIDGSSFVTETVCACRLRHCVCREGVKALALNSWFSGQTSEDQWGEVLCCYPAPTQK